MMDNLLYFSSSKCTFPAEQISRFISFSKRLQELNDDIKFEDNYWKSEVNFVKVNVSSKDRSTNHVLHSSILDFAKAYVKYQRINSKLKTQDTILAIRVIEKVCLQKYGLVDLTSLTIADFDFAVEIAKQNYKPSSAYHVGRQLTILLNFLKKLKIVSLPDWKNPIRKPIERSIVLDQESEDYRASKLPDEAAIFALADIFSRKETELSDRDIFITCAVSLLLSAPERASELFFLKSNCIHKQDIQSVIKYGSGFTDSLTQNEIVLGLRWYAQKNYGYDIKYIPDVMLPIVNIAVERLKKLSEKPRIFASLLEESKKFPRHALCPNVTDEELLTQNEVLQAMGFEQTGHNNSKKSGYNFLVYRGIPTNDFTVCLNDLNIILRNRLPKGFPYIPFKTGMGIKVKWSEALFSCFANQFNSQKPTISTELWIPHIDTLNEGLSPTKKNMRGKDQLCNVQSIFQKWGHGNLSITTHQFRHLLNTIANTNGMESLLLAKWSGRADIKQNRIYDHTSVEERNNALALMQNNERIENQNVSICNIRIATPRTLQELNTRTTLSMHTTEFGLCTHSYIDEPCLKYRNCLNCTEHICVKGDDEKKRRLQDRLKKEKILCQKDKLSVEKNVTGASKWLELRELTILRCEQMLALFNDPNIADGTPLRIPIVEDVTPLQLAYIKAGRKRLPVIKNTQYNKKEKDKISANSYLNASTWIK